MNLEKIRSKVSTQGIEINKELKNDLDKIVEDNAQNMIPFVKLFWDEQKSVIGKQPHTIISPNDH